MAHEELIQQLTTKITEAEQAKVLLETTIQEMKALIVEMQTKDKEESTVFAQRVAALTQKATTAID